MKRALLIAGPTASGKSAVALKLAERFGATIVNADAMQVYSDLRVLTARPSAAEERRAPHRLFGEVDGAENFSVGRWLARANEIIAAARDRAGPLIFVGGSGLYFRALTEGLSDIPRVPEAMRAAVRAEAEGQSTPALHARLAERDPLTAARVRPSDRQRVLRALEVVAATGRPLVEFHGAREAPALPAERMDRPVPRAGARGAQRAHRGALRRNAARRRARRSRRARRAPARPRPAGNARPWRAASDRPSRRPAVARRSARARRRDTRRYAKRQFTWARHQMPEFAWVAPEEAEAAGERALG